jgi:hypothetical protein
MHRAPLPQGYIPGTHFFWKLSRSQGHSAAEKMMSMKNSNDTIGNRSHDSPVYSAVPQPLRHRVPHNRKVQNTAEKFCRCQGYGSTDNQTARIASAMKLKILPDAQILV